MPWSTSKVLRQLKKRKTSESCIGLPPPGPSVFKPSTQLQQAPTPETSRRSVVFRDNRLPDGTSPTVSHQQQQQQCIPRPRLSSYAGSLDYSATGAQVRSSPQPPSVRRPPSGAAVPSLASYPASYQSNCYVEYESMPTRGHGSLQRPRLTNLPDFSLEPASSRPVPRSTYDTDIPSPDYPMLPSSTSSNSNRDSGLDSDSRSSSGHKPPYSPVKRSADYSQGWPYAQNEDPRMMQESTMRSSGRPVNQNYSTRVNSLISGANGTRQGAVCADDEDPYRSLSRNCQYNRRRWDDLETCSMQDGRSSRDFYRRPPLPKTSSLMNVSWQQPNDGRRAASPYRSRDYAASLDRGSLSSLRGDRHCGSCLCLSSIRDEIGHFASVGTNTETTSSASETLRSSPRRKQLAKTPLHSKEKQRNKTVSLELTWQAVGSEDEGRGEEEDAEEEVQDEMEEQEEEKEEFQTHTVYRPAFKAPPLPVSSSSDAGRATPIRRPPSAGGLRLPRSQPMKAPSRMPYKVLDDASQSADTENEDRQRFEPMRREGGKAAADDRSITFGSKFREPVAASPANRRFFPTEDSEDRSMVRI